MSLFTAAAVAARRKFPRAKPVPSALDAGQVGAFERARIDFVALSGGKTAARIRAQGANGRAIVRRPGVKPNRTGWIDYHARAVAGPDSFEVLCADGSTATITVTVTDALPFPYKTLAPSGGDYSDWKTAVESDENLVVRAGVYHVGQAYANRAILSAANRTIMAHPDDVAAGNYPIVMIEGASLGQFWTAPSGKWSLHDAATNTYISTATGLPAPSHNAAGMYVCPTNGRRVRLYYYHSLAQLTRPLSYTSTSTDPAAAAYFGPGFAVSGGRIYVRLDPPPLRHLHREAEGTYPWPDFGDFFPADKNPNTIKILFGYTGQGYWNASSQLLEVAATASNAVIRNIWFAGGGFQTVCRSTSQTKFQGCRFLAGAKPEALGENYHGAAITLEGSANVFADRCVLSAGWRRHMTYRAGKTGGPGLAEGNSAGTGRTHAWDFVSGSPATPRLEIANSELEGYFIWGWSRSTTYRLQFRHCDFLDGGMEAHMTDSGARYLQWFRCRIINSMILDYSYKGGTTAHWNANRPNNFIVNCLILDDLPHIGASGHFGSGGEYTRWSMVRWYKGHEWNGPGTGHPFKYIHCTSVTRNRREYGRGFVDTDYQATKSNSPHNVSCYNNLLAMYKSPIDWTPFLPMIHSVVHWFHPTSGVSPGETAEVNNNYYFKHADCPSTDGILALRTGWNGEHVSCADVAAIRTNTASAPGGQWETEGDGGYGASFDPRFKGSITNPFSRDNADYCLQRIVDGDAADSPCLTGARDLSARTGWDDDVGGCPDYDGPDKIEMVFRPHRGCFDPAVPAGEQEIGPL